jgi:xylan 1,4-beta-xylosidase
MVRRKGNARSAVGPLAAWWVVLFLAGISSAAAPAPGPASAPPPGDAPRTITIRADRADGNCYAFWRVGNFNQPHQFLDPNYKQTILDSSPFVQEVNAVYFLGGRWEGQNEWFLGVGADGNLRTDFRGMIAELRGMIGMGLRPRIVLDNVPFRMSDPPQANVYGNTAPPADERVWRRYVQASLEAMVSAFGRQTVAGWSFRVGTEPDLRPGHWAGTKEEWLAHYDYTVDAFTSVLPEGQIGAGNILNPASAARAPGIVPGAAGPSTASADGARGRPRATTRPGGASTSPASMPRGPRTFWGLDIIDHCADGNNAATGGKGTRLDSFSCSWYARVGGSPRNFDDAIDAIRNRLARYPKFADLPIDVGEHAVLSDELGRRLYAGETTEWSAGFYAFLADRVYARNVRTVYEWDHATGGVLHPKGQVIGLLERMVDGRRLAVDPPADPNDPAPCGAIACRKDGRLFVLLYHHRAERAPGTPQVIRLEIADPALQANAAWRVSEWGIDANRTVWAQEFLADCAAAGVTPLPGSGRYEGNPLRLFGPQGEIVFAKNRDKYRRMSELPQIRREETLKVAEGKLTLLITLPGHSVRFLELSQAP